MVISLFTGVGTFSASAADKCGYDATATMTELYTSGDKAALGDCYSISSSDEMLYLAEYVNSGKPTLGVTFYLTNDVNLRRVAWTPVANLPEYAFQGIFDGCGFAVLRLTMEKAEGNAALFGYVSGEQAVILNLGVMGTVSGTGSNYAGIAANLEEAYILNCWNAVDVRGDSNVGGIVGDMTGGSIENCCNYGYIEGLSNVGALAGSISEGTTVDYSYFVYYSADRACGSIGSGCRAEVYRFASSSTEVLTEKVITVASKKTDDLMVLLNEWVNDQKNSALYRTWVYDTSDKGVDRTDGRYPSHNYPGYIEPIQSIYEETATMTALYESAQNAPSGSFYSINTEQELVYFEEYVNTGFTTAGVTFFLTKDMLMPECLKLISSITWRPIGNDDKTAFQGVFDAQGFAVLDMYINDGENYRGLFGYVDNPDACIKNLGLFGRVTANDSSGGIVGYLISGNVTNCWFDGEISGDDRIGGIVGRCGSGTITNCVNFATVSGNRHLGGIVGNTGSGSTVKYCYYNSTLADGCGDTAGTQISVIAYDKNGSDYTLQRSVAVGSASGVKLLNVLNHWVTYLALDNSYRPWKYDDSAAGIARIQGDHPTHLFPNDGSGVKYVDEPYIDVDDDSNPYKVFYTETATMTELYESGIDGVAGGHYSISDGDELKYLSLYVQEGRLTKDVTFYLKDDVDITIQCWGNNAEGWLPIGSDFRIHDDYSITYGIFRGNFDGCGYTVSGLYIYNEKGDNVGLFGRVSGGTIKNLGVQGAMVAEIKCGGIVGEISNGIIENCWTAVSIQSESQTGGIAGTIDDTTITNCTAYGAMLCYGGVTAVAGGVFGDAKGKSVVTNCYYIKTNVSAGYNSCSSNCTVDVIGFDYGFYNDDYYCTLERAATINELMTTDLLDALNAWVRNQNNGLYCGWYNSAVMINIQDGTSGHFPRLMEPDKSASGENEEYCGDYTATSTMSSLYSTRSDGIEGCYYSINGLDDLEAFQKYVNEGFKTKKITFFMTRDIDMSQVYSLETEKSWTPVGVDLTHSFQGTFDGQGYTVQRLYISNDEDDQGLFGHINQGAVIKNLGISGIVKAGTNAGGIVGDFNFSTIANCWSSVAVTAVNNAGGIVGGANMGTIVNCANYAAVYTPVAYGAIAGFAVGTTIKNCYYLYGTCQQAWPEIATPIASNVAYFNGTSAACILQDYVDVEGTSTRNALSALKLYVDAHPETNYCYWTVGNTEEYVLMGVVGFPVLLSASNTMGSVDKKVIQAYYNDTPYYSVVKAVNAANDNENGGDVTLAANVVLKLKEDMSLDENVRLLTGDFTLNIKSQVKVYRMQQLQGVYTVNKDGGRIMLWDEKLGDYRLFMYAKKDADPSCNSEFFGIESLTFLSNPVKGDHPYAYNLTFQDGEFFVNSTLESGNPHKLPAGSTITLDARGTLNILSNARIRTTGDNSQIMMNGGKLIIGNATLNTNGGTRLVGVFEDDGGIVSLPFVYRDGYTLRGWTDANTSNLYTAGSKVEVPAAATLTAQWKIGDDGDAYPGDDYYKDVDDPVYNIPITVIQSQGGKISPDSIMAAKGENLSFSFAAIPAYYIKNVLLDGESVQLTDHKLDLVSVSRPHTIIALYAPVTNVPFYDWKNPFLDVKSSDWCYDAVRYVASAGLFSGTSTDTFSPNATMTRDMVVVVLWRLAGCPVLPDNGAAFSDVPKGNYAYDAVRWANHFGIVMGFNDGTFGYGKAVTREQLITFLYRFAKNYAGDNVAAYDNINILGYTDVMNISKGMTQPFQWGIGAGIVSGTSTTTLSPKDNTTRAQVAAILTRYCNKFFLQAPVFTVK